jgi:LPPG:FO 2-phospho-L-lactate transferase
MLTALAGGVGAARFLRGLVDVVDPASVTAVVNTADDEVFHGLHVAPDLDSVTYTLADASDPEQGWGLAGESFTVLEALRRFGVPTWFGLGDRDLATHVFRTTRLADGASLSEVTAEITAAWGVRTRLIPMTDDRVRTRIDVVGGESLAMQEWFVREHAEPPVAAVHFDGAERSRPAPGVLDAIATADAVLICPSNPVISIGPIVAVPGIREALTARRAHVVAVSPIVGGAPVRGPADRLMRGLGMDVSCLGVARAYAPFCGTIVVDAVDERHAAAIEAEGLHVVVTDTIMRSPQVAADLARRALEAVA